MNHFSRLMIPLFFLLCVVGRIVLGQVAGSPRVASTAEDSQGADSFPGPTQMRAMVSKELKVESSAKAIDETADSIVRLCDLHAILRLHPAFEQSGMLKSDSARIRRRLISTKAQLIRELEAKNIARPNDLTSRVEAVFATPDSDQNLSQVNGGGAFQDQGWELVELIQQTLHPHFWDVGGGPGSIRYFAMRRVLVVRATTEVHEDLAALLRKL